MKILLGGNQVIPPSATISKKTLKNGNPFYVYNNDDCFIVDFIKTLLLPKIANNLNLVNPKQKPTHQVDTISLNKNEIETDKYLE